MDNTTGILRSDQLLTEISISRTAFSNIGFENLKPTGLNIEKLVANLCNQLHLMNSEDEFQQNLFVKIPGFSEMKMLEFTIRSNVRFYGYDLFSFWGQVFSNLGFTQVVAGESIDGPIDDSFLGWIVRRHHFAKVHDEDWLSVFGEGFGKVLVDSDSGFDFLNIESKSLELLRKRKNLKDFSFDHKGWGIGGVAIQPGLNSNDAFQKARVVGRYFPVEVLGEAKNLGFVLSELKSQLKSVGSGNHGLDEIWLMSPSESIYRSLEESCLTGITSINTVINPQTIGGYHPLMSSLRFLLMGSHSRAAVVIDPRIGCWVIFLLGYR